MAEPITRGTTVTITDARVETTSIDGLELHHTKVLGDPRGLLVELIQGGVGNPVLAWGFRNLYASIATGKHVGRAAHFHFKNCECFFTLTGTALWFFHDFRKGSPTSGESYACVAGFHRPPSAVPDPVYVLEDRDMVRFTVPAGVYHAYWPLTDAPVMVVSAGSQVHDDADYDRRPSSAIPGCREWLSRYGITLSEALVG